MSETDSTVPPRAQDHFPAVGPEATALIAAVASGTLRIPVVEERLQIGKRTVDRGGYRITKQVSATEETVDEALRSDTVQIERRPVGTLIDGSVPPAPRQEGDTYIVPVVKEVLVTEKRLLLVEEVCIRRVESSYRDPQHVTLRKENIVIERLEADSSD